MELEKKLAEHRARKRKSLFIKKVKSSVRDAFSWMLNNDENKMSSEENVIKVDEDCGDSLETSSPQNSILSDETGSISSDDFETQCNWSKFFLYVLLWCSLFGLAVFAEFGAVFIILSGFVFIWINTRTNPRRPGEVSAYSVFNPNCEAIQGTLDAKQFEKELHYGVIH